MSRQISFSSFSKQILFSNYFVLKSHNWNALPVEYKNRWEGSTLNLSSMKRYHFYLNTERLLETSLDCGHVHLPWENWCLLVHVASSVIWTTECSSTHGREIIFIHSNKIHSLKIPYMLVNFQIRSKGLRGSRLLGADLVQPNNSASFLCCWSPSTCTAVVGLEWKDFEQKHLGTQVLALPPEAIWP